VRPGRGGYDPLLYRISRRTHVPSEEGDSRPGGARERTRRKFKKGNRLAFSMPLYMDTHRKVKGVTAAAVAEAHAKDLKVQGKHGVNYRSYWVDEKSETIFCLVEAPSPEAAARVHKEAHGLVADEIHEVHQG
jgi:hypothetical protein